MVKADRFVNEVFHRLPDYLAWNASWRRCECWSDGCAARIAFGCTGIADGDTESRDPAKLSEIRDQTSELAAAQVEVERASSVLAVEQLLAESPPAGAAWRIELLLELPFLSAEIRRILAEALADIDAALVSEMRTPAQVSPNETQRLASVADSPNLARRAVLAGRMCQISFPETASSQLQAFMRISKRLARPPVMSSRRDSAREPPRPAGRSVARPFSELARGDHPWSRTERESVVACESRSAAGTLTRTGKGPTNRRSATGYFDCPGRLGFGANQAAAYDLLVWHGQRAVARPRMRRRKRGRICRGHAEHYRQAAAAIPNQPPLDGGSRLAMTLTGPERVALTYRTQMLVDFKLTNTSATRQKFWVAIDANEQLVAGHEQRLADILFLA